jgi:hypothetical protein
MGEEKIHSSPMCKVEVLRIWSELHAHGAWDASPQEPSENWGRQMTKTVKTAGEEVKKPGGVPNKPRDAKNANAGLSKRRAGIFKRCAKTQRVRPTITKNENGRI